MVDDDGVPSFGSGEELQIRQCLIDAALDLALREHSIPCPVGLAEKTGIDVTVIQKIYPSLDELAIDIRLVSEERYWHLEDRMPSPTANRDKMLDELVQFRATLYEAVGELRLLGDAGANFIPSLVKAGAVREGVYRSRLLELFCDHFGPQPHVAIGKIELLTSWETWRHLRNVQRLSKDQAQEVVRALLRDVTVAWTVPV